MNFPRVVIGENNRAAAAQAGRKRRPKWVPVVWGIAGHPAPGGYKHGGMAFHVGDWAACRQTVTLKSKIVAFVQTD